MKKELIIFTDLDGTLLNEQYSFKPALEAIQIIRNMKVPLILCSSKTHAEILHLRKQLENTEPFISENGGGIYVPGEAKDELRITSDELRVTKGKDYYVINLGASYNDLRNALKELRAEGFDVKGFGDMSVDEVVQLTGLNPADAKRAKQREFDEPFVFFGDKAGEAGLKRRIRSKGFNYTKGEIFHIMGDSDKGRAVEIVKNIYAEKNRKIMTAALGDSPNDIEMLQNVDYPVVVQKKDGTYNRQVIRNVKGCIKADGIGPVGWNKAIIELLSM
jgi:mannosyl-3-phosphoglycerate phosphatase family protein